VLKTVVKDEAIWVEMFNRVFASGSTIRVANDSGNSFKIFCQEKGFITGLPCRGKHSFPVRDEHTMVWI
jgi:hypothetical protein